MQRWTYDSIIQGAESGDPCMMLELAKLYKAGAFGESDCNEYIFWLKQFFMTPKVESIVQELEERYDGCDDEQESSYTQYFDMESSSFEEYFKLIEAIIEAGLSLGIFYRNSSQKEELELSMNSLVAALDASGWDYLEHIEPDGTQESILSILAKTNERYKELGFLTGEEYE